LKQEKTALLKSPTKFGGRPHQLVAEVEAEPGIRWDAMLPWQIDTKHVKLDGDNRVLEAAIRSTESFNS
jgi:hypothetical protein